jgi:hypothetical protein
MREQFLALSRILIGVTHLDCALGSQYLDRLLSTPLGPAVSQVLERFAKFKADETLPDQVKKEIVSDDTLRPAVCQIILLWYTSALWDNETIPITLRYGTQDEYFSGLAWSIIGAHPPGLSGGYFGHWRYRPENEPKVTPP